ncbi:class I SAM-dependent methyltransferase [Shewanella sp. D64]|uniref:class I SAM-dependent methyltransferase n=1 Tax=unclassified Shewanella TaxID=196818 RepID=UPI0022BA1D25|nr:MULTISPECIES: class I SAM-dependent methyltransferase [unclassified Shewanella]MEC4728690.1 class I SAM-dependent methyltransferase [Shewanella sp. D64]MEC4740628.1 class I SAM-dependent methyltransferase [Shewanella sp. E94]WBJ94482.1 class I SAM-dependent methyltransferase [Shewanella sp. MTB7]
MEEKKLKVKASSLVTEFEEFKQEAGHKKVLDLACGNGRNGLWFAKRGHQVTFIDRSFAELIEQPATQQFLQWDLEDTSAPELPVAEYDLILVFNYLHRPLFSQIRSAVKPGGLIIYETFIDKQAEIGRPKNPKFLLKQGELKFEFDNWTCLHYFEGEVFNNTHMSKKAQLIARKPS